MLPMHSNVTIKNVSWPHFSWPTLYVCVRAYALVIGVYRGTACNATHSIAIAILPVRPSVRPSEACTVTKLNAAL